jgi:hypothetical protein
MKTKDQILWEKKLYEDFLELTEGDVPIRRWVKTQLKKLMQTCEKKGWQVSNPHFGSRTEHKRKKSQ